jgi:hypothetical protein
MQTEPDDEQTHPFGSPLAPDAHPPANAKIMTGV